MKRIIYLMLALFLSLSTIYVEPILASEGVLKSVTIENFEDRELAAGDILYFDAEYKTEVESPNIDFYFLDENNECVWMGGFDFSLDELYKWKKSKNYKFMYLELRYSIGDDCFTEYYSKYSKDYISSFESLWFDTSYPLYNWDDDYSFTISNHDYDETAPNLASYTLTQNGTKLDYLVDTDENQSMVKKIQFNFANGLSIVKENYYGVDLRGTIDLNDCGIPNEWGDVEQTNCYTNFAYGNYNLESIQLCDRAGNEETWPINTAFQLELKAEDNALEDILDYTMQVDTAYVEDKIFLRKDTKVGADNVKAEFVNDAGEIVYSQYIYGFDRDGFDASEVGNTTITLPFEVQVSKNRIEQFEINVDVCVVEVIGRLKERDYVKEECFTLEEFNNKVGTYFSTTDPIEIDVVLNTGETIKHSVEPYGWGTMPGMGNNGAPYVLEGNGYAVNPKYSTGDDNDYWCTTKQEVHIYLQDENHNLVDKAGNIRVAYADRKDIVHESNNENVSVISSEGSVPTYTEVSSAQENLDEVFDNEYVAYDITLLADEEEIQPVDGVQVTFTLGEDLQNKEVEIYYVDDNGNKELITTTMADETVTFEADHFSTYAIVEKTDNNSGKDESNDNNQGAQDNPNNENDKAPGTGDSTNLSGLIAMLIASSYILIKRKEA